MRERGCLALGAAPEEAEEQGANRARDMRALLLATSTVPLDDLLHLSDWRTDTDLNYATVLTVWDRPAGTFRMRSDPKTLVFGLGEFTDPGWQTWWGMMKTPFV